MCKITILHVYLVKMVQINNQLDESFINESRIKNLLHPANPSELIKKAKPIHFSCYASQGYII